MNANKKRVLAGVLGVIALSASGIAFAGQKLTTGQEVIINTGSGWARGGVGYARNTSNTVEFIGCYTEMPASGSPFVFCSARNSANQTISCSSSSLQLAQVLNSLNGDSYLLFTYNSSGTCTSIRVENYSSQAPKVL